MALKSGHIDRRRSPIRAIIIGLNQCFTNRKAPSQQAVDLMTIMPHIDATGILIQLRCTWAYYYVVATGHKMITNDWRSRRF
jgi:glyceraldehyde-3-phosphate dehydrogenase (NAD(P))